MTKLTLEIGEVVVLAEAERAQLIQAEPAIQEAFRLLGQRLDRTPFGQFGEARTFALERVELSALPLDELLSPRGAERLADELYQRLLKEHSWQK
ncbi:MAG TPA: hypothetical protein VER03_16070 [Bryobacteraceae bacterium]|nr:hypothetical protein [Bryobacteraceae bacterium]